jgi:hypothetical protein
MKSIRNFLIGTFFGVGLIVGLHLLHAQTAATPVQGGAASTVDWNSASDLEVMLQAIESVPPAPAASAPRFSTFYSAQHAPGTRLAWPPLPGNAYQLPVWNLGDGIVLLDDRNVNYAELQAESDLAAALSAKSMRNTMAMNLASSYAYGNRVYLTNMAAVSSGYGNVTASFSIAGGTNFVPYDILMSTNVATPFASWNWLGIGYTSNRYTFSGQPADNAFYLLAKPSKTMTVAWGDDYYGESDVPSGMTNAIMVSGGIGYSLALLADGTVVGWGNSSVDGWVPTNLVGVAMEACGYNHNVALFTNGMVTNWGYNGYGELNMPANLTNVAVISAQAWHSLVLASNGMVTAWGYDTGFGESSAPAGLTSVTAIACGGRHNLAVSNGFVVPWGDNSYGQLNVPTGLSNVVDVAAGWAHSVALKNDGTVVAWGDNSFGQTNVPAGLTNAVAIAAGGFNLVSGYTMILKKDGTVVTFGDNKVAAPVGGLNHVIAIGGGFDNVFAIRSGPPTPVVTLEPVGQYQVAGGNVTFTAKGQGLYGVTYQWQTNAVNLSGATNATLTLTNAQAAQQGAYAVVVTDNGWAGSIASSNASFVLVTPPVITWQSLPTNVVCIYGNYVSFASTASAPGQTNGFPLHYQWRFNGTNIPNANTTSYGFFANDSSSGIYSLVVTNLAGSTNASWWVTVTNAINVTNDLLLIYNTNSANSTTVLNYYLAHRPMVSGANVLGIGCPTSEIVSSVTFSNQILAPYLSWLTNNPAKHPQYLVLFLDVPTRVEDGGTNQPGVQYQLYSETPGGQPFVTSINMNGTNDCIAYINKLASFGTNGQFIISASAGHYGNTNYILDNARHGPGYARPYGDGDFSGSGSIVSNAISGLTASGVSPSAIIYNDGLDTNGVEGYTAYNAPQITGATNVAGYICWGEHSALGEQYATNNTVKWIGNSSWWIIATIESFNGQVTQVAPQGNFIQWFSSSAFGGLNYTNTPIAAISNVEEPGLPGPSYGATYFGLWASGKPFGICAWNARNSSFFQAVGDPFVTK